MALRDVIYLDNGQYSSTPETVITPLRAFAEKENGNGTLHLTVLVRGTTQLAVYVSKKPDELVKDPETGDWPQDAGGTYIEMDEQ